MTVIEITAENIKEMAKKLKSLDKDWVKKLSEVSMKEPHPLSVTKIYNILNSTRKHQQDRRTFIKCGLKLYEDLATTHNVVAKLVAQEN